MENNSKRIIGIFDIILNKEVIATSKPCNPFSEGFRKGLEQIAKEKGVSISRLSVRRHRDASETKRKGGDARRAEALAASVPA